MTSLSKRPGCVNQDQDQEAQRGLRQDSLARRHPPEDGDQADQVSEQRAEEEVRKQVNKIHLWYMNVRHMIWCDNRIVRKISQKYFTLFATCANIQEAFEVSLESSFNVEL